MGILPFDYRHEDAVARKVAYLQTPGNIFHGLINCMVRTMILMNSSSRPFQISFCTQIDTAYRKINKDIR